jgi:hypothetical protein
MQSRYAGRCKGCNKPYAEGEDIFWTKETGAYCWDCHDNPKPGPESYALAQRLGWLSSDAALHRKWSVFSLSPGTGESAAGRTELPTRGLFDSVQPVSERSEGEE